MPNLRPDSSSVRGYRIFTCGHSFHAWIGELLTELAEAASIHGHRQVGTSMIGRSEAIWHWNVPDEQNEAKAALRAGEVDVLTLSCMTFPDEGIRLFTKLAVAHNPGIRVNLQELWLPEDRFPFDAANRVRVSVGQFDASTMEDLKPPHDAYFKTMEDYVRELNTEIGQEVVFIAPDAQATLALRQRILAGTAPGLRKQSDLFVDAWGHPSPILKQLSAYTHFATIYRRPPLGLPPCAKLGPIPSLNDDLLQLLQGIAWDAVTQHPMSGCQLG